NFVYFQEKLRLMEVPNLLLLICRTLWLTELLGCSCNSWRLGEMGSVPVGTKALPVHVLNHVVKVKLGCGFGKDEEIVAITFSFTSSITLLLLHDYFCGRALVLLQHYYN
ncbi:hypothetical protein ACJX0J_023997, partial [Zea mays]